MSSLARKHIQNGLERSRNKASLLKNPFTLFRKQRISPKTLPREIAAREDEEEEISKAEGVETTPAKDQICSASVVERMDTHQISVGLCGTSSKTDITRRNMTIKTKMLVNLLILLIVLLHIVILELMK